MGAAGVPLMSCPGWAGVSVSPATVRMGWAVVGIRDPITRGQSESKPEAGSWEPSPAPHSSHGDPVGPGGPEPAPTQGLSSARSRPPAPSPASPLVRSLQPWCSRLGLALHRLPSSVSSPAPLSAPREGEPWTVPCTASRHVDRDSVGSVCRMKADLDLHRRVIRQQRGVWSSWSKLQGGDGPNQRRRGQPRPPRESRGPALRAFGGV